MHAGTQERGFDRFAGGDRSSAAACHRPRLSARRRPEPKSRSISLGSWRSPVRWTGAKARPRRKPITSGTRAPASRTIRAASRIRGSTEGHGHEISIGPNEYTIHLTARGKTKRLIDSSHQHPTTNMMQPTTKEVVEKLIEPWKTQLDWKAEVIKLDKMRFRDGAAWWTNCTGSAWRTPTSCTRPATASYGSPMASGRIPARVAILLFWVRTS